MSSIVSSTNPMKLLIGDSQTNYVKGSNNQKFHNSLSIFWNQHQSPIFFTEHTQRQEKWRRDKTYLLCSDGRSSSNGWPCKHPSRTSHIFNTSERRSRGTKLWPGFFGFTSSLSMDKNGTLSLNWIGYNGYERFFWPLGIWGVLKTSAIYNGTSF